MMDDFVRNFLCRTGMQRSLEIFETEWYEVCRTLLPAFLYAD